MPGPPVTVPDIPKWLAWGRERIDRIEPYWFKVERLIGQEAATRFFNCGRSANFAWYNREDEKLYPLRSFYCGFWFCPLCAARRKGDLRRG
jgi:hypothetical protein